MKFDNTEKPRMSFTVLPEGTYKFTVADSWDAISKAGNEMIKVKLAFVSENHETSTVFEYLLSSYPKKICSFCQSTGLLEKYNDGELVALDCYEKEGYAELTIEKSTEYGDRNKVKFFVAKPKNIKEEVPAKEEFDDDIPF